MQDILNFLHKKKIHHWDTLTDFIKAIPYGRNANREDYSLVLKENKGTCSSKHALLKALAHDFDKKNVQLIIGMFKMNGINMPLLSKYLEENQLEYIPEAHCYLRIEGKPFDYTIEDSLYPKIEHDILEEIIIEPHQVAYYKVAYHKEFLKKWIKETHQSKSFDEIWKIRENCIQKLSE